MAKIKIKNRAYGTTVYNIPEVGDKRDVTRIFGPGEIKEIDEQELEALSFVPGGAALLRNYLQILDEQASTEYVYDKQPEYDMSEEDVIELLQRGSYDAFLDCLDFAPAGVLDLIKSYAVSLPLNDSAKREAIRQKLGFDVDKALIMAREDGAEATSEKPSTQPSGGRRTSLPQYKVVTTKE